ncbi:MAG TPA: protein-glutamate O-methyltransferase CheR [Actinomycetota bacterium]|nr:protein-glutamate O-methyltransferase CheR [Actinomycetota bacterium]
MHGDLEDLEIELLLEAIYRHYGFDFRSYARSSIRRRMWKRAHAEGLTTISALTERVLHEPACMERLMKDLSVNVTSMFRDPSFYLSFRKNICPILRTYPFVRIWNAGCSTGEETYSLAIILKEEGLYDRTRIYATDINQNVLDQARAGVVPLSKMRGYTDNYLRSGGTAEFSEYYVAREDRVLLSRSLSENVVFAQHNLVSDRSFNEFNVIICRNVMIYFSKDLQDNVHELLYNSLVMFGVLALGRRESIRMARLADRYKPLDDRERMYRRIA